MARLALRIFCRKINISDPGRLMEFGPLLLVANHPNSFFDAILIGALFKKPVHFLARGDAFHKPWHSRLLRLLNMIPVYRLSEGKENLCLNEEAFIRTRQVLAKEGIVLIFIEGICVHKHELQPFKKGAARIAWESRNKQGFRILPVAVAYDSFTRFGKTVNLNIGEPLLPASLFPFLEEAKNIRHFNTVAHHQISDCIDVPQKIKQSGAALYFFLLLPAILGYLMNAPLYMPLQKIILAKTKGTVFYDSVLFGSLLLLYPVFVLLVCMLLLFFGISLPVVGMVFCLFPISAWSFVRWRPLQN